MAVQIYIGEPPEHIKEWIVEHYGPTPAVTGKITLETEDGETVEVDPPLTTEKLADYKSNLVSISYAQGVEMPSDSDKDLFVDFDKLAELSFEQDIPENIATLVTTWGLGITSDGLTTHLVVMYFNNGVVVINDADDSSGEVGIKIDWDKFVKLLEDYPNTMNNLPEVGKTLIVPYMINIPNETVVDTEWQILGYNASIPRYVKYKNGDTRVYMDVIDGSSSLLRSEFEGATVYSDKAGTTSIGTVASPTGTFTYGNNATYSVPTTITVDGTTYEFCGYNVTLQSMYSLADFTYGDGVLWMNTQFRSFEKSNQYRNDWSDSEVRDWLNGSEMFGPPNQSWWDANWYEPITGTVPGLTCRLTDEKFTSNVIPTVNRTWVHDSWTSGKTLDGNQCEHVSDRFWLLGIGNINCLGSETTSHFKDQNYDTTKFSDIFKETDLWSDEKSHIRRAMKADGSKGLPCHWWLRSAHISNPEAVGRLNSGGGVTDSTAAGGLAILPACLIG